MAKVLINRFTVDYEYDFPVFAISSSVKPYKLAWLINKAFEVAMHKEEDLVFELVKDGEMRFTNYAYNTDYLSFRLIKNLSCEFKNVAKPYLLPEYKDFDYILKLEDESQEFTDENILNHLAKMNGTNLVVKINLENLKSKDNLIF